MKFVTTESFMRFAIHRILLGIALFALVTTAHRVRTRAEPTGSRRPAGRGAPASVRKDASRSASRHRRCPYGCHMSSTSASASAPSALSAAAANDRIRALVDAADGTWPAEAYEVLLLEWAEALHNGMDEAA